MKVLFVLENTIADLQGGTEVSSWHLARLLRKKGVEVEEWSPFMTRKPIFWYTSIFGQIYILIVLAWKLVKNRVNIIHIQGKYLISPAIFIGKLLKISTVATIRDYVVVCPIGLCLFEIKKGLSLRAQGESLTDYCHGFWFYVLYEIPKFLKVYHRRNHLIIRMIRWIMLVRGWFVTLWLRWWLKRADVVVAVSGYVQKVLRNYGVESQVIHNVFDPIFMEDPSTTLTCSRGLQPRVARARVRGSSGPVRILFVGKPSYGKGYDLFRLLSCNKVFRNFKFITVGGENKIPYLETLRLMRRATAVVVPSRWPEPFGRVALESLMMGTPVVAARRGGLAEIIEEGKTGILTEPTVAGLSSGLRTVIDKNSEFRKNIRLHNRKLREKFMTEPTEKHLKMFDMIRV